MQVLTNQPHLLYDVALCHYKLKQYDLALKPLNDIIERGIREHPGLLKRLQEIVFNNNNVVILG